MTIQVERVFLWLWIFRIIKMQKPTTAMAVLYNILYTHHGICPSLVSWPPLIRSSEFSPQICSSRFGQLGCWRKLTQQQCSINKTPSKHRITHDVNIVFFAGFFSISAINQTMHRFTQTNIKTFIRYAVGFYRLHDFYENYLLLSHLQIKLYNAKANGF